MHTSSTPSGAAAVIDQRELHALGVLVPIQFSPIKVLPGRHPLGRPGDGMRVLRTRPYVSGEDNPRDIDKFSPPHDRRVTEWEDEAQASVTLVVDVSASMASPLKAPIRNACVMQLTYSLWRAGDRVGLVLFDNEIRASVRAANLRSQIRLSTAALLNPHNGASTDVSAALNAFVRTDRRKHSNVLFVLSDFVGSRENDLDPESAWRTSINELQQNIVPVIVSFEIPPIEGVIKLWDPERASRRVVSLTRRRVRQINRRERQRTASLARRFRAAGLDSLTIVKQNDVYPQLVGLARARRRRRV